MNKAYKFRIYPNAEQRIMFAKTFGCVRFVYNRMLADKFLSRQQARVQIIQSIIAAPKRNFAERRKKFSRSKKGSHNREKIRVVLSLVYEKVTNRRKDFLQKLSTKLVNAYDAIAIEDLDLKAMAKRKRGGRFSFGKSISDNGWSMFTRMLKYKFEWQGKSLVRIDRWYPSSQLCSECGYQNSGTKNLSVREWTCPKCGTHHDRDHNAAINIKNEGMRILA